MPRPQLPVCFGFTIVKIFLALNLQILSDKTFESII